MRTLGRIALILLIVVPSLWAMQRVWNAATRSDLAAVLSGRIASAFPSSAYRAVDARWLEFALSGQGRALRVRTNGVVEADAQYPPETQWWYAFEYQLLDGRDEAVRQGVYHHRTRLTRFRDPDSARLTTRNFLLDPALEPTDGRSMVLYFGQEILPERVRIRPIEKASTLQSVLFRVYEKVPNPEHQLGYLWQRLGDSKKMRLARGSVYGLDLLRDQEKQNLLRYEWSAVGPSGVEEQQYATTKLYIAREHEGETLEDDRIPSGLYCGGEIKGMVPIPEGDWDVTLSVVNLGEADAMDPEMTVHWYGRGVTERWRARLPAASGEYPLGTRFNGGQLEIAATEPLVIRVWGSNGDERLELTPQPLRLRAYLIDASASLEVAIDHVADRATPFRVDMRARLQPTEDAAERMLDYEFLDAENNRIRSGRLPAHLPMSNYDHLAGTEPQITISDPVQYYFNLPPQVATVRFTSQRELMLIAYTRPPNLVRKVRVPEDYTDYRIAEEDLDRQPAWFLLRPRAEQRLRREFRSVILTIQPRPPETDPRLLAGDYDWTLYQPKGNWRARHLLVSRREDLPVRRQSLAAVFHELSAGQANPIAFRGLPGQRHINPTLLYLRDRSSPLDVKVMLGDRLHTATQIAGRQGDLQLPGVMPGRERLAVAAAEPVRWFINQVRADKPAYVRRLAMQVSENGLEFDYQKASTEAEVLSGELYTPVRTRIGVRVTIASDAPQGHGPWREWTFRQRLFDLRPDSGERIPVLDSSMQPLAGRQRFFLPLGSDLPPGRYRIGFTLEGISETYLTLYRLIPGQAELRTFYREPAYVQTRERPRPGPALSAAFSGPPHKGAVR
jgi:hypothetical protein